MNKQKINAFTLVELIVVITILAILGTIAFISLQGYSKDARDSTRISDLSSMKTSLEVFQLDAGKYPIPTAGVDITYSGATVWTQGTFGETVYANVSSLDKIPTDPITDAKYTYSTTQNRGEYQLGGMLEGDTISFNQSKNVVTSLPLGETEGGLFGEGLGVRATNAAGTVEARAIITGTYNGQVTKSLSGTTLCNIVAVPSIITNDTSITDLETINTQNRFVYRGKKNLPSNFKSSKFNNEGGFDFQLNKLNAYTDPTNGCKDLTSKTSVTERVKMLKGIQEAYSGTTLKDEGELKNILALDISDVNSPSQAVKNYAGLFVNNNLGGSVATSGGGGTTTTYSCTGSVPTSNVVKSNDTGLSADTAWQNTASGNDCYYECTGGYTGVNCDIAPLIGWRAVDSNCDIEDIEIRDGSNNLIQTWAGCNSTLGTGFEYGQTNADIGTSNYNGTVGSCYDYSGNNTATCTKGSIAMASNTKANIWFTGTNTNGDSEYANIWGKYYTWANSPSACPTGRHVPSDAEWETLETTLNGGTNCRNSIDGWLCDGLGWKLHNTKTDTNNLANRLKLPLAGNRYTDGSTFNSRGNNTHLWSSAPSSTNAYYRNLYWDNSTVYRGANSQDYGFSVRCIKD